MNTYCVDICEFLFPLSAPATTSPFFTDCTRVALRRAASTAQPHEKPKCRVQRKLRSLQKPTPPSSAFFLSIACPTVTRCSPR